MRIFSRGLFCCLCCFAWCATDAFAGQKYALIVGVQKYRVNQLFESLAYTENDATDLARILRNGGYEVTLMTTAAARVPGQEHLAPNSDYIRDQLATILNAPGLDEDDVVLIALAGHGVQFDFVEGTGSDQKRTPRFYFCPADAGIANVSTANQVTAANNLIDLTELYDLLDRCDAGGRLLLVDACRNDPSKPALERNILDGLPALPPPPGGIAAFLSCSSNETSIEDPELQNGVFFYHVIQALSGEADTTTPKMPADGVITLAELQQYVSEHTFRFVNRKYRGKRQTPELKGVVRLAIPLIELRPPLAMKPATPPSPQPGELPKITNSIGQELVRIPPGTFLMGSPAAEEGRFRDESPHQVELTSAFHMSVTEVTQKQYQAITGQNPSEFRQPQHPVEFVSLDQAESFCRLLSALPAEQTAGRTYRLPTEAEWEYCARAGSVSPFCFGQNAEDLQEYGWLRDNSEQQTFAVKQKRPNLWGLHDMHGNVAEWCSDWYAEDYGVGPFRNPRGPRSGNERVIRGGSFLNRAPLLRSAARSSFAADTPRNWIGFRVVMEEKQ
jgi:formylglycine-generating enzyme required for sulfatase activity